MTRKKPAARKAAKPSKQALELQVAELKAKLEETELGNASLSKIVGELDETLYYADSALLTFASQALPLAEAAATFAEANWWDRLFSPTTALAERAEMVFNAAESAGIVFDDSDSNCEDDCGCPQVEEAGERTEQK